MAQYHIIKQQTADILFSEREKAPDVFTDVSRLFNSRIKDITEAVFNEQVEEDVLVRIDTLQVDLGSLPYPFPEEEMATRYRNALEAALASKLKELQTNREQASEYQETQISISIKAFFEHYLLTGALPWWGGKQELNDPETVFSRLMEEEQEALKALIYKTAQYAYVRKRLVYGFTEKVVQGVIYLVEPGQAAFILEYHKDVSQIQQKEQLVKAEASEFEKAVWVFILDYLFDESSSHFSRKLFVRHTLTAMAARFNLSFARVLFLFDEAIHTSGELLQYADALPAIIKELAGEVLYNNLATGAQHELWEVPPSTLTTRNEKLSMLSLYLLSGSFTPGATFIERHYLIAVFLDLMATVPSLMKELLLNMGEQAIVKKRLAHEFNDEVMKEAIRLIEPAGADFIINYSEVTLKIQEEKSIVKTEASVFKNVLWEFILTFLFSERGSVFNKKMFLESNVRQLARHYNIEFNILLSFLAQGITEELSIISDNSSLFYLLIDILKETNNAYRQHDADETGQLLKTEPVEPAENKPEEIQRNNTETILPADQELISAKLFVENLLLFWMEYGYLPWWAANETTLPEVLLDELIMNSPDAAITLLRQVIMNRRITPAFFEKHAAAVFKIVEYLDGGKTALSHLALLGQLQVEIAGVYSSANFVALLAMSIMDAYKETRFTSFKEELFFSFYIHRLAREIGTTVKETVDLMITVVNTNGTNKQAAELSSLIRSVESLPVMDPAFGMNYGFSEESVLKMIHQHPVLVNSTRLGIEDSLIFFLEYFLRHNRLPVELNDIPGAQTDDLIFRMLVLLQRLNATAVMQLLSKEQVSSKAKIRLHDLFFTRAILEAAPVKALLATHYERDLARFIAGQGIASLEQEQGIKELLAGVMASGNEQQRKAVLSTLLSSPSLAHYMARNFKGDVYFGLLTVLGSEKLVAVVRKLQYVFQFIAADSFERENLNSLLREFSLLWFAGSGNTNVSDSAFIHAFLKFVAQQKNWNMLRLSEQFNHAQKGVGVFTQVDLASFITEVYGKVLYFAEDKKYREFLQGNYFRSSRELLERNMPELLKKEEGEARKDLPLTTGQEETKEPAKELLLNEQIYIQNAGLILLHPFLPTFFTRTNLMHEGKFIDEHKQFRAPCLLQYAVTGSEKHAEHQMVLNKILSGIKAEEALPEISILSEQEKQVSNELLRVVIQQWEKMKNTSIEGFRTSFLQREGALTLTADAWVLKIEQRGYDILLQTLPWGMGMIKTSWMDKPLIVEWI